MGGNVLEIKVTDPVDLGRVSSLVAGFGSAPPRVDRDLNEVSLPIKGGTKVLIAAGRAVDDDGIALEDLAIRRPSLDDVFLALTGHTALPGPTDGASAHGGTDG